MRQADHARATTRRGALAFSGAALLAVAMRPLPARAALPDATAAAIRAVTGGAPLKAGGVTIDIPRLVESGASVSVEIEAESAMRGADRCTSMHLFTEKNPQPEVASFLLGAGAPRARVDTRIRMADSQHVHVVAGFADGTWRTASIEVIITIAACLEE